MRFPQSFIEQVRLASDLVPLIMEDTVLKGKGDRLMGLCPFPDHTEKTPSFSVSRDRQVYYCFGCMKSGNIFTYFRDQRGLGFVEAVEYLARQAGLSLPVSEAKKFQPVSDMEGLFGLNEKVCEFYRHQLDSVPLSHKVKTYLEKRAYIKETIQSFKLGYASKGNTLLKFLTEVDRKRALHLGLLNKNDRGEMYDTYRNRLMFPILSSRHQVIGFGARALDDSLPKYINSKESDVFHKGRSLYGLDQSLRFLRQEGFALIVEGYTDFLSLWQGGIKNLAATLGTALTDDQARLLKRYVDSVILVFDGDSAGIKAGERSLPLLLSAGLEVKSVILPEGQDPDRFVKTQGIDSFKILIQNSEDLFFHILRKKIKEMKERRGHFLSLIDEIAPFLGSVQNKPLR
ncbi:MAG: DNA primase, partial [Bdellovibrionales bacterium]|nr:DNA primase [Bdellovibrionales bacterium]